MDQIPAFVVQAMPHGQGLCEGRSLEVGLVREQDDELPVDLQIGPQGLQQGGRPGRFGADCRLREAGGHYQGWPGRNP